MILVIFALFSLVSAATSPWDTLTANIAVVEFQRSHNQTLSEDARINENVVQYVLLMSKTSDDDMDSDMYIFPEGSLGETISTSEPVYLNTSPCHQGLYHSDLIALSCLAEIKKSYIVTNIVEQVKCENPACSNSDNCKNNGSYFYNTDVVFDRTGAIAHIYRKYNLFGENSLDRPEKPHVVTFETDFGIKFGIFTCFDILFQRPAQDVLKEGIDAIIYPTNWQGELPFLTALQSQQMFAYEHNIVLFAAGGNYPREAAGGTGVHRGSKDSLFNVIVAEGGSRIMKFQSVNGIVDVEDPPTVDSLAKDMDAFALMADNSLENYTWIPLNTSLTAITEEVCSDNFCCHFNIDLTYKEATGSFYKYFLGAFAGVRSYPGICDAGLEVCAIIACLNSSISSCGQRFESFGDVKWPVTFNKIAITAQFELNENKTQFPNSLLASVRPIDASQTNWTKSTKDGWIERCFATVAPQDRLLTFAIYGRDFALDVFPRDGQNSTNETCDDDDDDDNAGSSTTSTLVLIGVFVTILMAIV